MAKNNEHQIPGTKMKSFKLPNVGAAKTNNTDNQLKSGPTAFHQAKMGDGANFKVVDRPFFKK